MTHATLGALSISLVLLGCSNIAPEPADTVVLNGTIYTANSRQQVVEAMAVRGDTIIQVGDEDQARALIGPRTRVIDLDGGMAMPGLHDIHVHPVLALERMTCALPDQNAFDLPTVVDELKACLGRLGDSAPPAGGWITVSQFNGYGADGDGFLGGYASVREGLSAVSDQHVIYLSGADGHVFAVNDFALTHGATLNGTQVVINRESLGGELAAYADYFDVDDTGNPTGIVKDAGAYDLFNYDREPVESLIARSDDFEAFFTHAGVTSAQEAWADARDLEIYRGVAGSDRFRVRLSVSPSIERDRDIDEDGHLKLDEFMRYARAERERVASIPNLRVESIKIMVDGVAEYPTQTAALKHHYLAFDQTDNGHLDYRIGRDACHSRRCEELHYGVLELSQEDLNRLTVAADAADFSVHFHVIGDAAVEAALVAVEGARASNPESDRYHNLSHIQQVDPADIARFGAARVAITPTMSWFAPWYAYDISVIPYFDEHDNLVDLEKLYDEDRDYIRNLYPIRSLRDAGALLAAGSDVPVDSSVLRPFTDIMYGLLRGDWVSVDDDAATQERYWASYGRDQRLPIRDLLDAYSINGAKALHAGHETGSLEVGKLADFIVLNQNIIALAETLDGESGRLDVTDAAYSICDAHYAEHCRTRVLQTWIGGELVYETR